MIFEEAVMAHSYHHAVSSARKWGGTPDDYIALHTWFDSSKEIALIAKPVDMARVRLLP